MTILIALLLAQFTPVPASTPVGFAGSLLPQSVGGTGTGSLACPPGFVLTSDGTKFSCVVGFVNATSPLIGAKCDWNGTTGTDDSVALQTALNSSSITQLSMPCGQTCLIGSSLTIPSGKAIIGCGTGFVGLRYTGPACALVRNSVQETLIQNLYIQTTNASASVCGIFGTNATGPYLHNVTRNVKLWSLQNPPVVGQYGFYYHSVNGNSMYYDDNYDPNLNLWDKAVYTLGDTASGGANAHRWFSPEINASTVGFEFSNVAGANFVYGLHCNGAGQAFSQTCLRIGDGATNSDGNHVELYADMGTPGKPYEILSGSLHNYVWSKNSSSIAGTNANNGSLDKNIVIEMNATSNRVIFTVGNVQLLADSTNPGILFSPNGSTNPGFMQCNATNTANTTVCFTKANLNMTNTNANLWEWRNASGFTNSSNCKGSTGTCAAAIDLNGGLRQAGSTFANLSNPGAPPNGTLIYCSDCVIASTCAGSGTGAYAKRLNGAWVCN